MKLLRNKHYLKILTFLLVLLLSVSIASAINYPELKDFVTDQANIIDSTDEIRIIELAKKIEQETTVEVAIVTISSLEGIDIETYAVELF